MSAAKKVTSSAIRERKGKGERIAAVTAYETAFARLRIGREWTWCWWVIHLAW